MLRPAAVAGLATLLTACATQVAQVDTAPADTTRVDHALLLPPGQPRYRMDELTLFVMPMELDSPPPTFPSSVAAGDVAPVTVCVEAWLDAAGICRFPPALRAKRDRGDCTGSEVELTHVPVRLTYAFTFERRAGRERIASARQPREDNPR